jgi:hypothetical protein
VRGRGFHDTERRERGREQKEEKDGVWGWVVGRERERASEREGRECRSRSNHGVVIGMVLGMVLGVVLSMVLGVVFGMVLGVVLGIVLGMVLGVVRPHVPPPATWQ